MSEQTKKIIVPPFLLRRLEAFRIVRGDEQSYVLRDKLHDKVFDFDPWQFFLLESLAGCETVDKLQSVFEDRFDRKVSRADIDALFGSIADNKLLDEAAATHPLLAPYMRKTYVVEDGKATPKPAGGAQAAEPAPAPEPEPKETPGVEVNQSGEALLGLGWLKLEPAINVADPRPALRLIAPLLHPLRHLVYAIPLLAAGAIFLVVNYWTLLAADLEAMKLDVSLIEHLIFWFFSVSVVSTVTAAVVADAFKVSVDQVGIYFAFRFMPRWVLKMTGADRLTRRQTMWLHGSVLLARVVLFSIGALFWYNYRDAHTGLTEVGLLLMFSAALGLLFESGNPLIKANAYYLLSAYLNESHLRAKAYATLLSRIKGDSYKAADSNLLALYALLSFTYVILLILAVAVVVSRYLTREISLGGSTLLIMLSFIAYMLWRNYAGLKQFGETYQRQVQFDRWRTRTLPGDTVEGELKKPKPNYWKRALLLCFLIVLFVPYPYEPSGNFTIFPVRKAQITTDTPGIISAVFFDGGEAVNQGTVLAQLQHDDFLAHLKTLDADIEEQKHVIANLKTLPKPEEIQVAAEQLEVARSHVPFSRDKLQRLEKIYPSGAVTLEEVEAARKEHSVDKQQVLEKEAALALAKTGPTAEHILSAQSKLVSLQEQRAGVAAKIERMTMRMPFDGNILTLHLQDRINSYLPAGQAFAEVENTGHVTAQIQVVESDLQYIKLGQAVHARVTSYFYDDFDGKVTTIDRNVTPKSFGSIVNVIATFDNKDGRLKTGMSGQAKIAAEWMPVWQAFTHSIIRFIRLQLWSWVP